MRRAQRFELELAMCFVISVCSVSCAQQHRTMGPDAPAGSAEDAAAVSAVRAQMEAGRLDEGALLYETLAEESGDRAELLQVLCRRIAGARIREIVDCAGNPSQDTLEEEDIWFVEDVGGPEGSEALKEIYRRLTTASQPAVEAAMSGQALIGHNDWLLMLRSAALAALVRTEGAEVLATVSPSIADVPIVEYSPFLSGRCVPPPVVYFRRWPDYRAKLRQREAIVAPELLQGAKAAAVAIGYGANGAFEYLKAAAPDEARRAAEDILPRGPSWDRGIFTQGEPKLYSSAESLRTRERVIQEYYQFEILREAVCSDLVSEECLRNLASDAEDKDRAFWGTYGLARKGDQGAWDALNEQSSRGTGRWKWLATAALASLGSGDALNSLKVTCIEGDVGERVYESYAVAALFQSSEPTGHGGNYNLEEILRALGNDASYTVLHRTIDRSYWLPPGLAAEIVAQHMLSPRQISASAWYFPEELVSFAPKGWEGEMREYMLQSPGPLGRGGARGILLSFMPDSLATVRDVLLSRPPDLDFQVSQDLRTVYAVLGSRWKDAGVDTSDPAERRARCLGALAYLGDADAARELCDMADKGLDLPERLLINAPYPCMLPRLREATMRLARSGADRPLLYEAARSCLIAIARSDADKSAEARGER